MHCFGVRFVTVIAVAALAAGSFAQTAHHTAAKHHAKTRSHHATRHHSAKKTTKHTTKGAKAMTMSCPVCHMPLSMNKTAANPTAIHLNGKTMYCCAQCKMPAAVMGPAKHK